MAKRTSNTGQADLRQEAKDILDDDEIPVEETPVEEAPKEGKELDEKDMPVCEEGVEYYLFSRNDFYDTAGVDHTAPRPDYKTVSSRAQNSGQPLASKSDVLKFCRTAAPGTYVLVKVMDELEVAPPKEANIVRSNPRLKKPRKAGEA